VLKAAPEEDTDAWVHLEVFAGTMLHAFPEDTRGAMKGFSLFAGDLVDLVDEMMPVSARYVVVGGLRYS